ncbi:hypothetical protein [Aeromicrobium duanguangcaii]|uniref:arsenate reductase/protein-tyrosine-phosphatase family protein n=1 Tax=Aeromicrobium duanguangcaii TaxID=2968086 RepID=UPI002017FB24|nr:hypothetical protein [Aeromicrobium duanguangcaii]MCL3837523.1 hypothetical protein [Aeromicrobium duanguangcaii]
MPDPLASPAPTGDRFVVTVVCTANICRSPALAMLLREGLAHTSVRDRVVVWDAGTKASEGEPGCSVIADRAGSDPAPMRSHRARAVTRELIAGSDLILTASASERGAVAQLDPGARTRTFTVLEAIRLDRLAEELDTAPAGLRVRPESLIFRLAGRLNAARSRGLSAEIAAGDDIPDAHTSRARHVDVARQVSTSATALTAVLARAAVRP